MMNNYVTMDYGHAQGMLKTAFGEQWEDIQTALENITIVEGDCDHDDKYDCPVIKKLDKELYPLGWREIRFGGDLIVNTYSSKNDLNCGKYSERPNRGITDRLIIENYLKGLNVDFWKGDVAFNIELSTNSLDFDYCLRGMKRFYDLGAIDVGVILTMEDKCIDLGKLVRCPILLLGVQR